MHILAKFGFGAVTVIAAGIGARPAMSMDNFADDPAIVVCDAIIKEKLNAFKDYERVKANMIDDTVYIQYEATNSFDVLVTKRKLCAFKEDYNGKFVLISVEVRAAKRIFDAVEAEISETVNINSQRRRELLKIIDDTLAMAMNGSVEFLEDTEIANRLDIYPIDPSKTQLSVP